MEGKAPRLDTVQYSYLYLYLNNFYISPCPPFPASSIMSLLFPVNVSFYPLASKNSLPRHWHIYMNYYCILCSAYSKLLINQIDSLQNCDNNLLILKKESNTNKEHNYCPSVNIQDATYIIYFCIYQHNLELKYRTVSTSLSSPKTYQVFPSSHITKLSLALTDTTKAYIENPIMI